jgi:hypothetical protein
MMTGRGGPNAIADEARLLDSILESRAALKGTPPS